MTSGDLGALTQQYLNERVQPGKIPPTRVGLVCDFARWLEAHDVSVGGDIAALLAEVARLRTELDRMAILYTNRFPK